jgi:hypothetical protein
MARSAVLRKIRQGNSIVRDDPNPIMASPPLPEGQVALGRPQQG